MSSYKFRNLVFEGGGVKGAAYGGALEELEERGILNDITRVAGTSAGAITAVLLAVGYSPEELTDIIANTNFGDFADSSDEWFIDAERILTSYGFCKGDYFRKWIGNLIKRKHGRKNLKFNELSKLKNSRELYLVATNLSEQTAEIFSHEHTPDVEIRDAARMSMGIPLYFECVLYGKDREIMVDGGVTCNYPLNIFDNTKYLCSEKNGDSTGHANENEKYVFNDQTLGFRLDSSKEIEFNKRHWSNVPTEIRNIYDYVKAIGVFMMDMANKEHLCEEDWNRTVFIDTLGVKATDFDLPKEKIQDLIEQGRNGVKKHFAKETDTEITRNNPA